MPETIAGLGYKEWEIMKICWKKGKTSIREVYNELGDEEKRSYQTIRTMMERLVEKKFLEREMYGPIVHYSPKVAKKSVMSHAINSFLHTVVDNAIAPVLLHVMKNRGDYIFEIDELKQIIKNMEKD